MDDLKLSGDEQFKILEDRVEFLEKMVMLLLELVAEPVEVTNGH